MSLTSYRTAPPRANGDYLASFSGACKGESKKINFFSAPFLVDPHLVDRVREVLVGMEEMADGEQHRHVREHLQTRLIV